MQHSLGNGSLTPLAKKHPTVFTQVGYNPVGSFTQSKSSMPQTRTQELGHLQQLQGGGSPKKDALQAGKSSKARPSFESVSPPAGNKHKGKPAKKSCANVSSSKQKLHQLPQRKEQLRTQKVNTEAERETGSGAVKRKTDNDDQVCAEMLRVKITLCSEGYTCQKFAFKSKVKHSKEIRLRMIEEYDKKTGKKDYRLIWSKLKKGFSIITELKSVTRGFDASPVLQRNQTNLRDFTILGKQALKLHCISFHFRNRSLDLVFKHVETAESLENFVNFLREKGGLE